ncbi:MAG: bifunctional nuclease family protein [Halobacteriales archaeon]
MDVSIDAVRVAGTPDGPVPVVLLAPEPDSESVLPIFIGFDEAVSIARGLDAEDIGRPLTHDLLLDVMEELGGRVERVVVSAIVDSTYIADLHVNTPRGEDAVIDARPSDSMALAARTGARVECNEEVFEDGRQPREEFAELQDIREVVELG